MLKTAGMPRKRASLPQSTTIKPENGDPDDKVPTPDPPDESNSKSTEKEQVTVASNETPPATPELRRSRRSSNSTAQSSPSAPASKASTPSSVKKSSRARGRGSRDSTDDGAGYESHATSASEDKRKLSLEALFQVTHSELESISREKDAKCRSPRQRSSPSKAPALTKQPAVQETLSEDGDSNQEPSEETSETELQLVVDESVGGTLTVVETTAEEVEEVPVVITKEESDPPVVIAPVESNVLQVSGVESTAHYQLQADKLEEQGLRLVYADAPMEQSEPPGVSYAVSYQGKTVTALPLTQMRTFVVEPEKEGEEPRPAQGGRRRKHPPKPGKHICKYCGHGCAKPSVLQKHLRSHTGERPYPCLPCGFSFKTKSNLYKHCKSRSHCIKAGQVRLGDSMMDSSTEVMDDDSRDTAMSSEHVQPLETIVTATSTATVRTTAGDLKKFQFHGINVEAPREDVGAPGVSEVLAATYSVSEKILASGVAPATSPAPAIPSTQPAAASPAPSTSVITLPDVASEVQVMEEEEPAVTMAAPSTSSPVIRQVSRDVASVTTTLHRSPVAAKSLSMSSMSSSSRESSFESPKVPTLTPPRLTPLDLKAPVTPEVISDRISQLISANARILDTPMVDAPRPKRVSRQNSAVPVASQGEQGTGLAMGMPLTRMMSAPGPRQERRPVQSSDRSQSLDLKLESHGGTQLLLPGPLPASHKVEEPNKLPPKDLQQGEPKPIMVRNPEGLTTSQAARHTPAMLDTQQVQNLVKVAQIVASASGNPRVVPASGAATSLPQEIKIQIQLAKRGVMASLPTTPVIGQPGVQYPPVILTQVPTAEKSSVKELVVQQPKGATAVVGTAMEQSEVTIQSPPVYIVESKEPPLFTEKPAAVVATAQSLDQPSEEFRPRIQFHRSLSVPVTLGASPSPHHKSPKKDPLEKTIVFEQYDPLVAPRRGRPPGSKNIPRRTTPMNLSPAPPASPSVLTSVFKLPPSQPSTPGTPQSPMTQHPLRLAVPPTLTPSPLATSPPEQAPLSGSQSLCKLKLKGKILMKRSMSQERMLSQERERQKSLTNIKISELLRRSQSVDESALHQIKSESESLKDSAVVNVLSSRKPRAPLEKSQSIDIMETAADNLTLPADTATVSTTTTTTTTSTTSSTLQPEASQSLMTVTSPQKSLSAVNVSAVTNQSWLPLHPSFVVAPYLYSGGSLGYKEPLIPELALGLNLQDEGKDAFPINHGDVSGNTSRLEVSMEWQDGEEVSKETDEGKEDGRQEGDRPQAATTSSTASTAPSRQLGAHSTDTQPSTSSTAGDVFTTDTPTVSTATPTTTTAATTAATSIHQPATELTTPPITDSTVTPTKPSSPTSSAKKLTFRDLSSSRLSAHLLVLAHRYPSLRGHTHPSFCTLVKPQPMYVAQGGLRRVSMYSNWQVADYNPNPLGLTSKQLLGLHHKRWYDVEPLFVAAPSLESNAGIVTHSSQWQEKHPEVTPEKPPQVDTSAVQQVSEVVRLSTEPKIVPITVDESSNEQATITYVPGASVEEPTTEIITLTVEDNPLPPPTTTEAARVEVFSGGYKSNEEYVYVRGRGRGKYVCQICGIRCKKPSMLKKHIRTHTDLRPYYCPYCDFSFKTKGNLTKHMKSKQHHKRCVELRIVPVPVNVESIHIDPEVLARQNQIGSQGHSLDSLGSDTGNSSFADEDEDDEEEETSVQMEETEEEEVVDDQMIVIEKVGSPFMSTEQEVSEEEAPAKSEGGPCFVVIQQPDSDQPCLVCIEPGAKGKDGLPVGSVVTVSEGEPGVPRPSIDKEIAHSLLDLSKASKQEALEAASPEKLKRKLLRQDSVSGDESPEDAQKSAKRLKGLIGELMHRTQTTADEGSVDGAAVSKTGDSTEVANPEELDSVSLAMAASGLGDNLDRSPKSIGVTGSGFVPPVLTDTPSTPHKTSLSQPQSSSSGEIQIRLTSVGSIQNMTSVVSSGGVLPKSSLVSLVQGSIPTAKVWKTSLLADPSLTSSPLATSTPCKEPVSPRIPLIRLSGLDGEEIALGDSPSAGSPDPHSTTTTTTIATTSSTSSLVTLAVNPVQLESVPNLVSSMRPLGFKVVPAITAPRPPVQFVTGENKAPFEIHPIPGKVIDNTVSLVDGKWTCRICHKTFQQEQQLHLHSKIHQMERAFRCEDCNHYFGTKHNLMKHQKSDTHARKVKVNEQFGVPSTENPRPYKCDDCSIAFRTYGNLEKHQRSKGHILTLEKLGKLVQGTYAQMGDNEGENDLENEAATVDPSGEENEHMTSGVTEQLADKMTESGIREGSKSSAYSLHNYEQHPQASNPNVTVEFQSELIDIGEISSRQEREALKGEEGERSTDKSPTSGSNMSLSQAVVTTDSSESTAASGSVTSTDGAGVSTGNAAHKCGICSQNFLSLELLKQHLVSHAELRPYVCVYCDAGFTRSQSLKFHLETHKQERPYVCGQCGDTFVNTDEVQTHLVTSCMGTMDGMKSPSPAASPSRPAKLGDTGQQRSMDEVTPRKTAPLQRYLSLPAGAVLGNVENLTQGATILIHTNGSATPIQIPAESLKILTNNQVIPLQQAVTQPTLVTSGGQDAQQTLSVTSGVLQQYLAQTVTSSGHTGHQTGSPDGQENDREQSRVSAAESSVGSSPDVSSSPVNNRGYSTRLITAYTKDSPEAGKQKSFTAADLATSPLKVTTNRKNPEKLASLSHHQVAIAGSKHVLNIAYEVSQDLMSEQPGSPSPPRPASTQPSLNEQTLTRSTLNVNINNRDFSPDLIRSLKMEVSAGSPSHSDAEVRPVQVSSSEVSPVAITYRTATTGLPQHNMLEEAFQLAEQAMLNDNSEDELTTAAEPDNFKPAADLKPNREGLFQCKVEQGLSEKPTKNNIAASVNNTARHVLKSESRQDSASRRARLQKQAVVCEDDLDPLPSADVNTSAASSPCRSTISPTPQALTIKSEIVNTSRKRTLSDATSSPTPIPRKLHLLSSDTDVPVPVVSMVHSSQ